MGAIRPSGRVREGGYTLLELVIALSILSFLALALSGGLQFGRRVWDITTQDSERLEARVIVFDRLRDWLSQAHMFSDVTGDRRVTWPVAGAERSLSISAPLYGDGLNDALYRINLQIDEVDGTLVAAFRPFRIGALDPGDNMDAEHRVLLTGLTAGTFQYFEKGLNGGKGRWVSAWEDRPELPAAFRLALTFDDDERVEFVTRPRITHEADCRFDPVSRSCR